MVMIVGHRGGRNVWPENSLLGFKKLRELNVDSVEFDVHLTTGGELLVIHDPLLERTSGHAGKVSDLSPGENRNVLLKDSDGQYLPTLDEVLSIYQNSGLELQIELKADADGNAYDGLEREVIAQLNTRGIAESAILTSFLPEVLETCRRLSPKTRLLSNFDKKSMDRMGLEKGLSYFLEISEILAIEKGVLGPHWDKIISLVPPQQIGAWVTNSEEDIAFWLAKPIRQITSDRPDLAVRMRAT